MYKLLILLCFCSISIFAAQRHEKADAFIIKAHPRYYKVLSPVKVKKKIGLIVQNKTLVKIVGKVKDSNDKTIDIISIEAGKVHAIEFRFKKSQQYYFIPISPPFQRIELKLGEKSYEVPSQR